MTTAWPTSMCNPKRPFSGQNVLFFKRAIIIQRETAPSLGFAEVLTCNSLNLMPGGENFVESQQLLAATSAATSLGYTILMTGMFMDYFGLPDSPTPRRGLYHIIDVPRARGLLPGTGIRKLYIP